MKSLVPLLVSMTFLASCGKQAGPSNTTSGTGGGPSVTGGPATNATPGGASPREAFDKLNESAKQKDFGGIYDIICPDDKDLIVFYTRNFGGMPGVGDAAKQQEFEAVLKKYNVPAMIPDASLGMMEREELLKVLAEMFKDVKDKRGFCVETLTFVAKNTAPGSQPMFELDGTLKDLKELGDTATAMVVDSDKDETPVTFRKVGGRWFFSVPVK